MTNQFPAFGKQISNWYLFEKRKEKKYKASILNIKLRFDQIDVHAATLALKKIVLKHESLRTTFRKTDNTVLQQIEEYSEVKHGITWISCLNESHWLFKRKLVTKQIEGLFSNLEVGPLFRCVIFKTHNNSFYLSFYIHHIISDDWSLRIIRSELMEAYKSVIYGNLNSFHMQGHQLKDYARDFIQRNAEQETITFWENRLSDLHAVLPLSKFYQRFNQQVPHLCAQKDYKPRVKFTSQELDKVISYGRGTQFTEILDESYTSKILNAAAKNKTMPPVYMQASIILLFCELFQSNKVLLITRLNGRLIPESSEIIGNLTGATYSYFDIRDTHEYKEIVRLTHTDFFESLNHPVYNPAILGHLNLARRCHVCINIISEYATETSIEDDDSTPKPEMTAHFPIECTLIIYKNKIVLQWIYNTVLFRESMIRYISVEHIKILQCMLTDSQIQASLSSPVQSDSVPA